MSTAIALPLAAAASLTTMTGGLFGIFMRQRLHLVLGFSAGAVLGVAFFDLIPEALEEAQSLGSRNVVAIIALGFLAYVLLDRALALHDDEGAAAEGRHRGSLGAGSLSIHSFIDGFAIGVAFQAGRSIGYIVAAAVLVHDFSDGLNTVNVITKSGARTKSALIWLAVDALAPIIGAAASMIVRLPQTGLGIGLALFAGFFLYIGASDLLPESHHAHPKIYTTLSTLAGAATLFAVTRWAG